MRLANVAGRAVVMTSDRDGFDVSTASNGRFGPGLRSVYDDWTSFTGWAREVASAPDAAVTIDRASLGPPSPEPRQIVAIGINYDAHAAETRLARPTGLPPVFTKFVSSLAGPDTVVGLPPAGRTDWEVELVVVIGLEASRVDETQAWRYVAGLTVGQDLSERTTQLRGEAPQYSLGKSFTGFAPTGPWLVTVDAFEDPEDLEIGCDIDGEVVQRGRTRDLIFSVPMLVAALSDVVTLYPGDLIFTGTPGGVGLGRRPPRFLRTGECLHSWIEGIGELNQTMA